MSAIYAADAICLEYFDGPLLFWSPSASCVYKIAALTGDTEIWISNYTTRNCVDAYLQGELSLWSLMEFDRTRMLTITVDREGQARHEVVGHEVAVSLNYLCDKDTMHDPFLLLESERQKIDQRAQESD